MAGRGKPLISATAEQMGFGKGDALPPQTLQPPPKYPPLDFKPLLQKQAKEDGYWLELKRELIEYFNESTYFVKPVAERKCVERYSDRYEEFTDDKKGWELKYDWSRLPAELKPKMKKKKAQPVEAVPPKKIKKDVDVVKKLSELEEKENVHKSDSEDSDGENEEKATEELIEDEEEDQDEEMDNGTDYGMVSYVTIFYT